MSTIREGFFKIEVGTKVRHGQRRYQVTHLLSVNRVLAEDLESGDKESLRIDDLVPESGNDESGDKERRDLALYSDGEWAEAQRRFTAIKPILDNPTRTREDVEQLAKQHDVHAATLYKWLKLYLDEEHVAALVPMKRGRKSGVRLLKEEQEKIITSAIEDLYLSKQRHKKADIAEEVMRRCRLGRIQSPHRNTVLNRISELDPAKTLRRRGHRDLARNRYEAIKGNFPGGEHPLAVVQIDHTEADVILVDETNRQVIGRPWLTLAIDIYSRMVVGFYLTFDKPSAASVGMCLAQAMCPKREYLAELGIGGEWPVWGQMAVVHTDNAKEFRGNVLKRACENYGIDLHWRAVPQPHWGGHIERLMGTMANELRKLPGTTFSNPGQRRGYDSEQNAAMTLRELERHLVDFIVNVYHQRIHSELGMPPKRKWEIGIIGDGIKTGMGLIPAPEEPLRVRLDFMPFHERSIQQYGVQIEKVNYYDPVLDPYINAMDPDHPKKKREFLFRRDPRNISVIYFFDPTSNRYCPIAYRNIGLPAVSARELTLARAKLKEDGRRAVDETVLFEAITRLRARVDEAKSKTKAARRQVAQRPPAQTPALSNRPIGKSRPVSSGAGAVEPSSDPFDQPIVPFDDIALTR